MSLSTDSADLHDFDYRRLIGTRLGNQYDVEAFIAEGGFGSVYRGRDTALGRRVAIKIGLEGVPFKNLAGEARRIATLDDLKENVVQVFGYGTHEAWPYLVMEFLDGKNLEAYWKGQDHRLDTSVICDFVQQVGMTLDAAHSRGLIHRDLKPSNIQVVPKGTDPQSGKPRYRYVLLDFGISALINDSSRTMQNITQRNAGTVAYMSPEQLHGTEQAGLESLSDIYAFGVILYQLLTGVIPFTVKNASQQAGIFQALELKKTRPLRFREVAPDREIPVKVEQLVRRCLEIAPEKRPQSMGEVVQKFLEAWPKAEQTPPVIKPATNWQPVVLVLTLVLAWLGWRAGYPRETTLVSAPVPGVVSSVVPKAWSEVSKDSKASKASTTIPTVPKVPKILRAVESKDALSVRYSKTTKLIKDWSVPDSVTIEFKIPGTTEPAQVTLHLIVCTAKSIAAARSGLNPTLNGELKDVHFPKQSFYLSEQLVIWQLFDQYVMHNPGDVKEFLWDPKAKSIVLSPDPDKAPPPGYITYAAYVSSKAGASPDEPATDLYPWMAEGCSKWIAGPEATLPSAAEWDWVGGFTNRPNGGTAFLKHRVIQQLAKKELEYEILRTLADSTFSDGIPGKAETIAELEGRPAKHPGLKLREGDHRVFPPTYAGWDTENGAMISITEHDGRMFRIAIPLNPWIGFIRSDAANQ